MASLIIKADIEAEFQITLEAGYTTDIINGICDDADAELRTRTNRTAFDGYVARRAKRAELLIAIDYLTTSNRDLVKLSISNLSETGSYITFSNGKTLAAYREEAEKIINDLRLPGTPKFAMTFADPSSEHIGDEGNTLY